MGTRDAPDATLGALAERFGLQLAGGDPDTRIQGVCALAPGCAGRLAFADGAGQAEAIAATAASAVVLTPALAAHCRVASLSCEQPRLAFARIARLFVPAPPSPGIHASAVVDDDAEIDRRAHVGAQAAIGPGCRVTGGAVIGPGCVLGRDVVVGADARIGARVSLGDRTHIGARVSIEPGAVIGGRGFGLVHDGQGWVEIPQMGGVQLGDDVEIGANTTIDRGALDDTIIEAGVKIDDQVHIGHNCVIAAQTVIAGCTGIAGSCTIGRGCMIGGGVGIGDHVTIADGVVITAASQVPKDIRAAGVYSSTLRAMPAGDWRRRLALFRRLDRIDARIGALEARRPKKQTS